MEKYSYSGAYEMEPEDGLKYELRLLGRKGQGAKTIYVASDEELQRVAEAWDVEDWNLYLSLNPVRADVSRPCRDEDIAERRDVLIDFDPERAPGCMATEEERHAAFETARKALDWLEELGMEDIVTASSGNGVHVHVPVAMANNDESTELVKGFLSLMNEKVGTATVKVDQSVCNAARICRLYGSMNRKGEPTAERPWRRSLVMDEKRSWNRASAERNNERIKAAVEKVSDSSGQWSEGSGRWSLGLAKGLLDRAGVGYRVVKDGGKWLVKLEHCPWESEHTVESAQYESSIIIYPDGRLGYKCFHSHCSNRGWKELRGKLQELIAEKSMTVSEEPWRWGTSNSRWTTPLEQLRNASGDIYEGLIETGFSGLDKQLRGLLPGQMTLLCGDTSCGKTTLAISLSLNLLERGKKVAYVSNEMGQQLLLERLMQAAAEEGQLEYGRWDWQVRSEEKEAVCQRLQGLVTHAARPSSTEILASLSQMRGVDLVVLDNLMSTDLNGGNNIYEEQKGFVLSLSRLTQKLGCHTLLVAHSKKTGKELPRINDIFGSSNIANLCDNIVMLHRSDADFEQKLRGFFKSNLPVDMTADCYVETMKNRTFGELGWSGLRYDGRRKRIV